MSAPSQARFNCLRVARPSAYRSPISTTFRLRRSVKCGQILRQQATANSRSLRSDTFPVAPSQLSIAVGSEQESHSCSGMVLFLVQHGVHYPTAARMLAGPAAVVEDVGALAPCVFEGVRQHRQQPEVALVVDDLGDGDRRPGAPGG